MALDVLQKTRWSTIKNQKENGEMVEWKKYQRTNRAEMTPYVPGMEMGHVSISESDHQNGSPKVGDMIARNPENHADKWLVVEKYFQENFAEVCEAGATDAEIVEEETRKS